MKHKLMGAKKNNHEGLITLEDRELNMADARKSLNKVKSNPIEIAKVKIITSDNFNTIFYISPKKASDEAYVKRISEGVKFR